jgi:hypothetical protein
MEKDVNEKYFKGNTASILLPGGSQHFLLNLDTGYINKEVFEAIT